MPRTRAREALASDSERTTPSAPRSMAHGPASPTTAKLCSLASPARAPTTWHAPPTTHTLAGWGVAAARSEICRAAPESGAAPRSPPRSWWRRSAVMRTAAARCSRGNARSARHSALMSARWVHGPPLAQVDGAAPYRCWSLRGRAQPRRPYRSLVRVRRGVRVDASLPRRDPPQPASARQGPASRSAPGVRPYTTGSRLRCRSRSMRPAQSGHEAAALAELASRAASPRTDRSASSPRAHLVRPR